MFRTMLSNTKFAEGHELKEKGCVKIHLPDDNPVVMIVLLHFVHQGSCYFTEKLSLATLAEVAILVDKYCMQQVVEQCFKQWMDFALPNRAEEDFEKDFRWLNVCQAFRAPERSQGYLARLIVESSSTNEGFWDQMPDTIVPSLRG